MKKSTFIHCLKCTTAAACGLAFFVLCLFWSSLFISHGAGDYLTAGDMHAGEFLLAFVAGPLTFLLGLAGFTHSLALCIRWGVAK